MEELHLHQSTASDTESLGKYASRIFWKLNGENSLHEKTDVCRGMQII